MCVYNVQCTLHRVQSEETRKSLVLHCVKNAQSHSAPKMPKERLFCAPKIQKCKKKDVLCTPKIQTVQSEHKGTQKLGARFTATGMWISATDQLDPFDCREK